MDGTEEEPISRLWLWHGPPRASVAAELAARGARRLEAESPPDQLDAAAADGEALVVTDLAGVQELIAQALGLGDVGARAIQVDEGRGAALVSSPRGWLLERVNVAGAGPHLAAPR